MDDDAKRLRAELDALIHGIGHDLRAPLRSLAGFTDALREEYGDALGADGGRYLQHVSDATERLAGSVDGMLELARVGAAEVRRADVDLAEAVRTEVRTLQTATPRRHVDVDVPAQLVVHADPALARVAVHHLVDNAWKFTAPRRAARIRLSPERRAGKTLVVLSDNGVGFDPALAPRLFRPFARLHGDEYPGVGLGLVVVRRIIERHGGAVEVDSQPDHGTTVRLDWGERDAAIG